MEGVLEEWKDVTEDEMILSEMILEEDEKIYPEIELGMAPGHRHRGTRSRTQHPHANWEKPEMYSKWR